MRCASSVAIVVAALTAMSFASHTCAQDAPAAAAQPRGLKQVLSDMAAELSKSIVEHKFTKVGALEFTADGQAGETLGGEYGLLGKLCAEQLERALKEASGDRFGLANRRRLEEALKAEGFSVEDVASTERWRVLAERAGDVPAIVIGALGKRAGRVIEVECKLVDTASGEVAASLRGTASLSDNQWAMLGRSVLLKPEDYPSVDRAHARPIDEALIEKLDERSAGSHPLANPDLPIRVKIMIDGKERECVFQGNDCFVPVRDGEVYEIWLENKASGREPVLMRLLVDGLNTIIERERDRGVTTYVVAKRVDLDEARFWVLDPQVSKRYAVRGFVTENRPAASVREFKVTAPGDPALAREKFADPLNMVTAAFYAPKPLPRGLPTGFDPDESRWQPGKLMAVVHLRFIDADSMETD